MYPSKNIDVIQNQHIDVAITRMVSDSMFIPDLTDDVKRRPDYYAVACGEEKKGPGGDHKRDCKGR